MKEGEEENLIIGGDFNIIRELGGMEMEGEDVERCSKDKTIGNIEVEALWVRDKDLYIVNRSTIGGVYINCSHC